PGATADPIGPYIATGWLGAGEPYQTASDQAVTLKTNALVGDGEDSAFEKKLRDGGEAVLKLSFADGRTLSVSTSWRDGDLETWRTRAGETDDQALMDDLAERLTQLLHEQGVAVGVDVWEDNGELGFRVKSGDFVKVDSLSISGSATALT